MIFFVYSNISSYFPNQPATEDPSYSWKMANDFCKLIGKELLYFMQQEELDDFTTMLLEIHFLPFVEAVFIGLKYNKLKVNLFILYELYNKLILLFVIFCFVPALTIYITLSKGCTKLIYNKKYSENNFVNV